MKQYLKQKHKNYICKKQFKKLSLMDQYIVASLIELTRRYNVEIGILKFQTNTSYRKFEKINTNQYDIYKEIIRKTSELNSIRTKISDMLPGLNI